MPKQKPQSKPAHRVARRKTKPKFDVPAGVGEAAAASWVYREDITEILVSEVSVIELPPAATPPPTPVSALAETIAAPIAGAIAATAAVAPEPAPHARGPLVSSTFTTRPEPISQGTRKEASNPVRSAALGLFGMGLGLMEFLTSTAVTLVTAPFGIVRRMMPD